MRLYSLLTLALLSPLFLPLQGCAVAAVGGAAATTAALAGDRRTAGSMVDDQAIEIKALHALSRKSELWKQSHISITSYNNNVLLVGQTPSERHKREIEETIRTIPKVQKIYNELSVTEPVSLAIRSEDSLITTEIKGKMIGSKEMRSNHVKVITEDGIVYLMGLTKPEEQKTATEIARAVPGVQKVIQIFEQIN